MILVFSLLYDILLFILCYLIVILSINKIICRLIMLKITINLKLSSHKKGVGWLGRLTGQVSERLQIRINISTYITCCVQVTVNFISIKPDQDLSQTLTKCECLNITIKRVRTKNLQGWRAHLLIAAPSQSYHQIRDDQH